MTHKRPNHALQPTAPAVTACAADRRPLSAHRHRPRQPPPWLSLGSLGRYPRTMRTLFSVFLVTLMLTCSRGEEAVTNSVVVLGLTAHPYKVEWDTSLTLHRLILR